MKIHPKLKAGCGALFLFGTGVFCGFIGLILLIAILAPRTEEWHTSQSKEFLVRHFSKRLKLDKSQTEQLQPGFEQFLEEKWRHRANYLQANHDMTQQYFDSIRDQLDPKQQKLGERVIRNWWKDKSSRVITNPDTVAP